MQGDILGGDGQAIIDPHQVHLEEIALGVQVQRIGEGKSHGQITAVVDHNRAAQHADFTQFVGTVQSDWGGPEFACRSHVEHIVGQHAGLGDGAACFQRQAADGAGQYIHRAGGADHGTIGHHGQHGQTVGEIRQIHHVTSSLDIGLAGHGQASDTVIINRCDHAMHAEWID